MKLLVWTLIEVITLFVFSGGILLWLKRRHLVNKETPADNPSTETNTKKKATGSPENTNNQENATLILKRFINNQMKYAVKQLARAKSQDKTDQVTLIKLWGTLLKAEARVLDTPSKEDTEEILKKHLSNALKLIFNANKDSSNLKELEQKLESLVQSSSQSNEVLQLKVELEKAQNAISQELTVQIESLETRLRRFNVKQREHNSLEFTLSSAQDNIKQLKQTLVSLEQENEFKEIMQHKSQKSQLKNNQQIGKHKANKQINSLNQIANRQQIVIDLLREKLREASVQESINIDESQEIAISRIEQMIIESDTLILQLENELDATNLSIKTLKSGIHKKSYHILESEQKLLSAKKTALSSFRESAQNQQSKVDDMKEQLNTATEHTNLQNIIKEHQNESDTLEKLLKESETCVTLLEHELDSARVNNKELLHTIETVDPNFRGENDSKPNNKFQQLENRHNELLAEHSQAKQQLLASIKNDLETDLRTEFNRKNLEMDRLQLAINDLEKKQLEHTKNVGE